MYVKGKKKKRHGCHCSVRSYQETMKSVWGFFPFFSGLFLSVLSHGDTSEISRSKPGCGSAAAAQGRPESACMLSTPACHPWGPATGGSPGNRDFRGNSLKFSSVVYGLGFSWFGGFLVCLFCLYRFGCDSVLFAVVFLLLSVKKKEKK